MQLAAHQQLSEWFQKVTFGAKNDSVHKVTRAHPRASTGNNDC